LHSERVLLPLHKVGQVPNPNHSQAMILIMGLITQTALGPISR